MRKDDEGEKRKGIIFVVETQPPSRLLREEEERKRDLEREEAGHGEEGKRDGGGEGGRGKGVFTKIHLQQVSQSISAKVLRWEAKSTAFHASPHHAGLAIEGRAMFWKVSLLLEQSLPSAISAFTVPSRSSVASASGSLTSKSGGIVLAKSDGPRWPTFLQIHR